MNPHCECEHAGFCARHQINKNEQQFRLCKGIAVEKDDCGFRFWLAWEEGRLGATSPKNPILSRDWECNSKLHERETVPGKLTKEVYEAQKEKLNARVGIRSTGVGDKLAERFAKLGFHPVKGCACKDVQRKLNTVSPQEVLNKLDHWAVVLRASARTWKTQKGGLWKLVPTPPLALFKEVLKEAAEQCNGHTE